MYVFFSAFCFCVALLASVKEASNLTLAVGFVGVIMMLAIVGQSLVSIRDVLKTQTSKPAEPPADQTTP